jgi:hypothetical protein
MADKKTPQFRSDAEKKKWTALQNKAGHSLSQIAAGKATSVDFKNVDKTLAGLSKMAKSVFSDAVKAAEKQVALVSKANLQKSKGEQEEFTKAVAEILKDQMPELLAQIKDIIELESLGQDDRFEKTLSSQLDAFASFLPPKDLPTSDDMVAIHEATIEHQSATDDKKWESRQKQLLDTFTDRVADVVKATILSTAMGTVSPAHAQAPGVPRLEAPPMSDVLPSLAHRAMSMVGGSNKYDNTDAIDVESRLVPTPGLRPALEDHSGTAVSQAVESAGQTASPTMSLSKAAESAIINAANAQTKMHEQIRDLLQGAGGKSGGASAGGGGGGAAGGEEEDEGKKADVWWRSFGSWIGDKYTTAKSAVDTAGSWLTTIGAGLASMLLAPGLYETIVTKAKELIQWDHVKKVVEDAWTNIKSSASGVVDWVVNKLGLGGVIDKSKTVFNDILKAIDAVAGFFHIKLNLAGDSSAPAPASNTTTSGAVKPMSPEAAAKAQAADTNRYMANTKAQTASGAGPTYGMTSVGGAGGSLVNNNYGAGNASGNFSNSFSSPTAVTNRSSVNVTPFTVPGNTVSVPGTSVSATPPVTTPVAGGGAPAAATNARPSTPSQSTSRVSIDSFGINSGVDDSLALMNLGVISG